MRKLIKDITSSPDKLSRLKKIGYENRMAIFGTKENQLKERHRMLETRVGDKMGPNQRIVSLISYAVLFSSDIDDQNLHPNERRQIEKAQETLVSILQRYVYATCPRDIANLRFSRIMESIVDLREMSDIMNKLNLENKNKK